MRDVTVSYSSGRGLASLLSSHSVEVLQDISLEVRSGEILGIAGESGSGKSTMAEAVCGLAPITSGSIEIRGHDVTNFDATEWRGIRSQIQLIFQDPFDSLNPRFTVDQAVGEPLRSLGVDRTEVPDLVDQALGRAELDPNQYRDRRPHELSGGERQRVSIARALVVEPDVFVADEPVSMLDVSTSAEILSLLRRLADDHGIAVMLISHDLGVLGQVCDRIGVLYLGRLVETGPVEEVFSNPRHHYTSALLAAVPTVSRRRLPHIHLEGEPPMPASRPSGCAFHPRCSAADTKGCVGSVPVLEGEDHLFACWHPKDSNDD